MARLECGSGERGEDSLLVDDCVVFLIDVALPAGRDVGLVGVRRVQGFEADEFMLCGDDSGGGHRVASIEVDVGVKATHGEGASPTRFAGRGRSWSGCASVWCVARIAQAV